LKSAIRDDNPVIVFEDKMAYSMTGLVPTGEFLVPIGLADVKCEGEDVTIVATSSMVQVALEASDMLLNRGISAEVVDPRTLKPLDEETILRSVRKTGRAVIVDEGYQSYGVTAEISATIAEKALYSLDAPVKRLGAMDVPIPFSPALEFDTIPKSADVVAAVESMLEGGR
jgi:pyruvate dehydrogenase E1 component beta subunit